MPTPWDDLKATGRTAARALVALKGASNLLNAEIKYIDAGAAVASSSTASVIYLSGVPQGDGQSERDGLSLKLKGGLIKLMLTANASASRTTERILLVADTRCQKALPTAAEIIDTTRVTGLLNLTTWTNRFIVLHDETTVIGTTTGAGLNSWWKTLDFQALMDVHINYTNTSAAITSANEFALYLVHWNNEATNTASLNYDSRLFFVDN